MMSAAETVKASGKLIPLLLPPAEEMDPDSQGGAVLLGVDGVGIISHRSSSTTAIGTRCEWRATWSKQMLVEQLREAVA